MSGLTSSETSKFSHTIDTTTASKRTRSLMSAEYSTSADLLGEGALFQQSLHCHMRIIVLTLHPSHCCFTWDSSSPVFSSNSVILSACTASTVRNNNFPEKKKTWVEGVFSAKVPPRPSGNTRIYVMLQKCFHCYPVS